MIVLTITVINITGIIVTIILINITGIIMTATTIAATRTRLVKKFALLQPMCNVGRTDVDNWMIQIIHLDLWTRLSKHTLPSVTHVMIRMVLLVPRLVLAVVPLVLD